MKKEKKDEDFLDLSSLQKAVGSFEEILQQPYSTFLRDGTIQRFEYTIELSWKFLQRQLKALGVMVGNPKDVFREAHRSQLLLDPEPWFEFWKYRNLTTHTYNENTANEVYSAARRFLPYAKAVLIVLQKRNERK